MIPKGFSIDSSPNMNTRKKIKMSEVEDICAVLSQGCKRNKALGTFSKSIFVYTLITLK